MKKELKSWRWSRLTSVFYSEWVYLNQRTIIGIFVALLLYWISVEIIDSLQPFLLTASIALGLVLIVLILANICLADDYFEFCSEDKKLYVYLYKTSKNKMHMVVLNQKKQDWLNCTIKPNYIVLAKDGLIYQRVFNHLYWYHLNAKQCRPVPLGYKFGTNIFMLYQHQNDNHLNQIQVFDENIIKKIEAEHFIMNNIFVPQTTNGNTDARALETPTDYFISKQNGTYTVWGNFENSDLKKRFCKKVPVPAVIFEEAGNTVILRRENDQYQEILRCPSYKTETKNIVIEKDDNLSFGGTVWELTETLELKKLYKGEILAINNDTGIILGKQWVHHIL